MYSSIIKSIKIGLYAMRTHGFALSVVAHRDLLPSIALKRKFLAVDLTVSLAYRQ
jgi:hypothetical protein